MIPDTPVVPVTQIGDVWQHGTTTVSGAATASIPPSRKGRPSPGSAAAPLVTDPPYGVEYDPAWREQRGIASDGLAKGTVLNDDRADWREAWALFPGDVIYCWHAALQSAAFIASMEAAGFQIRSQIIWDKTRLVIGRGDYHWQHEPALMRSARARPAIGPATGSRRVTPSLAKYSQQLDLGTERCKVECPVGSKCENLWFRSRLCARASRVNFEAKSETSLHAEQCAMSARKSTGGMHAKLPLEPLSHRPRAARPMLNKHIHFFLLLSY